MHTVLWFKHPCSSTLLPLLLSPLALPPPPFDPFNLHGNDQGPPPPTQLKDGNQQQPPKPPGPPPPFPPPPGGFGYPPPPPPGKSIRQHRDYFQIYMLTIIIAGCFVSGKFHEMLDKDVGTNFHRSYQRLLMHCYGWACPPCVYPLST